jgi:hypothetical protein
MIHQNALAVHFLQSLLREREQLAEADRQKRDENLLEVANRARPELQERIAPLISRPPTCDPKVVEALLYGSLDIVREIEKMDEEEKTSIYAQALHRAGIWVAKEETVDPVEKLLGSTVKVDQLPVERMFNKWWDVQQKMRKPVWVE